MRTWSAPGRAAGHMSRCSAVGHATVPGIHRTTAHRAYRGGMDVVSTIAGAAIASAFRIAVTPSRRRGDRHDEEDRGN